MTTAESQNGAHGFRQRVDTLGSAAQQFFTEAREAVHELQQTLDLRGRVDRHPYAMLGAAAAVGYVLGGGLFTSFTGALLKLGIRAAALPLVKDELGGLVDAALSAFEGRRTGGEPSGEA